VLSPRAAAAILLAPFVIAAVDWSRREPPHEPCGQTVAKDEWLSGLAPAAFLTGCVCLTVAVRVSAADRGGRAGTPTLAFVAGWLAGAIAWWSGGAGSPIALWAGIAYLLLIPAVPAVLMLLVMIELRRLWIDVRALAWLCAFVLVPGGVAVIDSWGTDFYC
jgi:hypothetical protein